jgi:hypothetical protein
MTATKKSDAELARDIKKVLAKPFLKLPKADKYEFVSSRGTSSATTLDPEEARALVRNSDGTLYAVKNGVGRVAAARIRGHVLSATDYARYLEGELCI